MKIEFIRDDLAQRENDANDVEFFVPNSFDFSQILRVALVPGNNDFSTNSNSISTSCLSFILKGTANDDETSWMI